MPMIPPAMVEISPWPPVPSSSPPQPPRRHRPDPQKDVFGYEPPEPEPSPHRDVLRWIQGLDLSHALRRVRRDVANGFVIAEIFSRYFPGEVEMHSYENGSSAHFKKDNWAQICRLSRAKGIGLPDDMVAAAMNSSPGAALALLESLYEFFTRRKLQRITDLPDLTGGSDMMDMAPKKTQATYGEAAAESVLGGPKAISSGPAANAPVEFGQVNMRSVDDAMALRKNLGR